MSKRKKIILSLLGFLVLAIGYGIYIEPYWIEVKHLNIEHERLNKILKDKTVVHIADLHSGTIGRRETQVLKLLEEINPDLILLTGDFVKWKGDYEPALGFLAKLNTKYGVFAVMGDYDYSNSRKSCDFCHESDTWKRTQRHKVRFLRDSAERINFPEGKIWIGGIDREFDRPFISNKISLSHEAEAPMLVLCHEPLAFDFADEDQDILMLAGDTHGGQVPVPSWLWKLLGYEKNAKYNQGLFKVGKKMMYVSRGIGTSHVPIRLFRRPELVVLHF